MDPFVLPQACMPNIESLQVPFQWFYSISSEEERRVHIYEPLLPPRLHCNRKFSISLYNDYTEITLDCFVSPHFMGHGIFLSSVIRISAKKPSRLGLPPTLHEVNVKSNWTKTLPDAYCNQQYTVFMCEKFVQCLMPFAAKVVLSLFCFI